MQDRAHASSDYLLKGIDEQEFLPVERGILGDGEDEVSRMSLL